MAFSILSTIGWFVTKKTVDSAYNSAYNIITGSNQNTLDKKLDKILEQNKILKKEINILKNNNNYNNDNSNNNLNIKIVDDYCSIKKKKYIKKLSKSCELNKKLKKNKLIKSDLIKYSNNELCYLSDSDSDSNSKKNIKIIKIK